MRLGWLLWKQVLYNTHTHTHRHKDTQCYANQNSCKLSKNFVFYGWGLLSHKTVMIKSIKSLCWSLCVCRKFVSGSVQCLLKPLWSWMSRWRGLGVQWTNPNHTGRPEEWPDRYTHTLTHTSVKGVRDLTLRSGGELVYASGGSSHVVSISNPAIPSLTNPAWSHTQVHTHDKWMRVYPCPAALTHVFK